MDPRTYTPTHEIRRLVGIAKKEMSYCRYGQAFLNKYPDFDWYDRQYCVNLWEDDNLNSVVQGITVILQLNGAFERI